MTTPMSFAGELCFCAAFQVLVSTIVFWVVVFPDLTQKFRQLLGDVVLRPLVDIVTVGHRLPKPPLSSLDAVFHAPEATSLAMRDQRIALIATGIMGFLLLMVSGTALCLGGGENALTAASVGLLPAFVVLGILYFVIYRFILTPMTPLCAAKAVGIVSDAVMEHCMGSGGACDG